MAETLFSLKLVVMDISYQTLTPNPPSPSPLSHSLSVSVALGSVGPCQRWTTPRIPTSPWPCGAPSIPPLAIRPRLLPCFQTPRHSAYFPMALPLPTSNLMRWKIGFHFAIKSKRRNDMWDGEIKKLKTFHTCLAPDCDCYGSYSHSTGGVPQDPRC